MAVYSIKHTQQLPVSLDTAWAFFSSPANLKAITPPYMGFHIHPDPDTSTKMYPGQIISYTVRPVFDLPVFWMTEITHVEEGTYFVDEQRVGPYTLWHHQHRFRAISGGVEMTDTVHYRLPFGWLGVLAHKAFVRRQLDSIFEFRRQALEQRFGKMPAA